MGLEPGEPPTCGSSMRKAGEEARKAIRAGFWSKGDKEDGPHAELERNDREVPRPKKDRLAGDPGPKAKKGKKPRWRPTMYLLAALIHGAGATTSGAITKNSGMRPMTAQGANRGLDAVTRGTLLTTEGRRRRMGGLGLRVATTVWELGVATVRAAKERGPPPADLVNNSNANGHSNDLEGRPPKTGQTAEPRTEGRHPAEAPLSAGGAHVRRGQVSQDEARNQGHAAARCTMEQARGPPANQGPLASQDSRTPKCEDGADACIKHSQHRN